MTDTPPNMSRTEHSPNQSVSQTGEGPKFLAQQTISGERTKGWVTNVLLAINICALIACFLMWRYAAMIQDLKRWDLDDFRANAFRKVEVQAQVDHELITAYGLQKAVQDAAKEDSDGRARDYSKRSQRSAQ